MFAGRIVVIAPALGVADPRSFVEISPGLTGHSWPIGLGAGVLAGWLMGLVSWLAQPPRTRFRGC